MAWLGPEGLPCTRGQVTAGEQCSPPQGLLLGPGGGGKVLPCPPVSTTAPLLGWRVCVRRVRAGAFVSPVPAALW